MSRPVPFRSLPLADSLALRRAHAAGEDPTALAARYRLPLEAVWYYLRGVRPAEVTD